MEADETLRMIEDLDGARSVRMGIIKEFIVVQDWINHEIYKRAFQQRPR